jgi:hypothetical protein
VEASTSAGAVVVADVGGGMLPYLGDVARLVSEVRQVVGAPRVVAVRLTDRDPLPELAADRPALLISSLGETGPAGEPEPADRWAAVHRAAEDGADVTVLVPHRRVRDALAGGPVRVIAWDDLAAVGRGRQGMTDAGP